MSIQENLKQKSRYLRNNMTPEERILWKYLRRKRINNRRFLRQYVVETFILDFYCPEIKLGIEVDGNHHKKEGFLKHDQFRGEILKDNGIKLLRFTNYQIQNFLEGVLELVEKTTL